jgi:ADP-ribose pyrophosphatase YjhB (NUDIX family)/ketosteroid isomerase-like protein
MKDSFDVVREWYRALNRGDLDAIVAAYHDECVLEHVFTSDPAVYVGRAAARERWTEELREFSGALPGGQRVEVRQIGGMETGWGWARARWRAVLEPDSGGGTRYFSGQSDFWVEDGRIRRHRSIARELPADEALAADGGEPPEPSSRHYPSRPVVGVGAVVVTEDGRVVLVKRQHEPLAGQWSLPGGALEVGESLEAGVAREIREETGLDVDVGPVVDVFDRILFDEHGAVRYHFVLVDYLCRPRDGRLEAGSDVTDVVLASPDALEPYRLTEKALSVIARACRFPGGSGS